MDVGHQYPDGRSSPPRPRWLGSTRLRSSNVRVAQTERGHRTSCGILLPWPAVPGTALRSSLSTRRCRCTASAVIQAQLSARGTRKVRLVVKAPTPVAMVKATNTMGTAAPENQAQPRRPSAANHAAITRLAVSSTSPSSLLSPAFSPRCARIDVIVAAGAGSARRLVVVFRGSPSGRTVVRER